MAKAKITTLEQAIKELDGKCKEYLIITIDENGDSGTIVSQGNPAKLGVAVEKASKELKEIVIKRVLSKILGDQL